GTPFRALATGEFIEEQIFNWTYTDEQRAKDDFAAEHPDEWNPYAALPQMRLLTYQMPDELLAIASGGEFDEFDLNEFFAATGTGTSAEFKHKNDVQKWLDIIRGSYAPTQVDNLKLGSQRPPFPYSDVRLLPYLQHSFWFLPHVASCHAMANLLAEKQNVFWHDYTVLTRALRQLADYGIGLSPNEPNPEKAVEELVSFLPVLAYDGSHMTQIDAGGILDIAMAGTSATLLARKWESALLVNVDNDTLRRVMDSPEAMEAVGRIEGWRALGDNIIETIINKSEKVKELKNKAKERDLTLKEKKQLTDEEKELKSKRKLVQEKLIKFATRIPAFMYLTDFRENTLQDVITRLEPELFLTVTGLTVKDFHLLVRLKVFNTEQMNQAVFAFRR